MIAFFHIHTPDHIVHDSYVTDIRHIDNLAFAANMANILLPNHNNTPHHLLYYEPNPPSDAFPYGK